MKKYFFILLLPTFAFSQKLILIHAYSNTYGKAYLLTYSTKDNKFYTQDIYKCKFGTKGIGKGVEGDLKTPLGQYKVKLIKKKNVNDPSFGGYFIEINYPNTCDRNHKKTGGDIGIHGGRNRTTRGCVRILDDTNEEYVHNINIAKVAKFSPVGTHIVITNFLPPSLVSTQKKSYLSINASHFWKKLLLTVHCKSEIDDEIRKFESGGEDLGWSQHVSIGKIQDVKDNVVNIRKSPSKEATIIANVKVNNTMMYYDLANNNSWHYISTHSGKSGYIHASRVETILVNPTGLATTDDADELTNVRAGASKSTKIIATVKRNQSFWYQETEGDWWIVVLANGIKGYMNRKLIRPVMEY